MSPHLWSHKTLPHALPHKTSDFLFIRKNGKTYKTHHDRIFQPVTQKNYKSILTNSYQIETMNELFTVKTFLINLNMKTVTD